MLNDFFLKLLDPCDQRLYQRIYKGLLCGLTQINFNSVTMPHLSGIMRALFCDHPEIFWLHPESFEVTNYGYQTNLKVNRFVRINEIKTVNKKYNEIADAIMQTKNANSDYYRLIALHQYMIKHIRYDNDEFSAAGASAAGPILFGKAKCSGIARMTKLLCDLCQIPCIIICGVACDNMRIEDHAWNLVRINGKWTHFDVTWDITIGGGEKRYDYFGLTDSEISQSHSWDRSIIPKCDSPELNFYNQTGQNYINLREAMVSVEKLFRKGNLNITGRIKNVCSEMEFSKYLEYTVSKVYADAEYSYYFNRTLCIYRIQIVK